MLNVGKISFERRAIDDDRFVAARCIVGADMFISGYELAKIPISQNELMAEAEQRAALMIVDELYGDLEKDLAQLMSYRSEQRDMVDAMLKKISALRYEIARIVEARKIQLG